MSELNVATKTIPTPVVLTRLKEAGQKAAQIFLEQSKADLNVKQTANLTEMFT